MASEADFPFAEYEKELNLNPGMVDEFEGMAATKQSATEVPLRPRGNEDPFYDAQLLARGLELPPVESSQLKSYIVPTEPIRDILGIHAVEQLNAKYFRAAIQPRLTLSASLLQLFTNDEHSGWWEDEARVLGAFGGFDYATAKDELTIVAKLNSPHFVNPNYIGDGYAQRIHIPVLAISNWSPDTRT